MNTVKIWERHKPILHTGDRVESARALFKQLKATEIPVVEEGLCLGTVTEAGLAEREDNEILQASDCRERVAVESTASVANIWTTLLDAQSSCAVITGDSGKSHEYVTFQELARFYRHMLGSAEANCLVVLKMRRLDGSMARMCSLAEDADCKVLNGFMVDSVNRENVYISLDLLCEQPEQLVKSLERHEIEIARILCDAAADDSLQERLNLLMSYLNV